MSIQLTVRISALETQVKELRQTLSDLAAAISEPEPEARRNPNSNGPRTLCPHCHAVPAYFLHVRKCAGAKNKVTI